LFNSEKYVNGFLYKHVRLDGLQMGKATPTIEELQMFEDRKDGDQEGGSNLYGVENVEKRKVVYLDGDLVKIISGELKNLRGKVMNFNEEEQTVTIEPQHDDLKDHLVFPINQVIKHFNLGDHVKVIAGRYEGETGMIVKVDGEQVVLFSDLNKKSLEVFLVDVQKSTEVAQGLTELGDYQMHDLISLGPQSVGVITRVDRQSVSVITNNGTVQEIKLQAIGQKKNSRNAVALDGNQNQLAVADLVKCTEGQHKGKTGKVIHLFRSFAFLHSHDMIRNAGVFVVRARQCVLMGGQNRGSQMIGYYNQNPMSTPGLVSPSHGMAMNKGGKGGKGMMMGGKGGKGGMRNDHLVNKKMMITRGQYKGYEGLVKEATDIYARIELQSKMKVVTVKVEDLKDLDSAGGGLRHSGFHAAGDMRPPATPSYAPNTPTHADHNPLATPSRDSAMSPARWNDAWDPEASARMAASPHNETPGYTPGGEYGSAVNSPYAHDVQSPYGGSVGSGQQMHHGHGPDTPGDHMGAGTPIEANPSTPNAFTPGGGVYAQSPAYGAPTPTPGSHTPGMVGSSHATPGGDVPTPGGWDQDMGSNDAINWLSHADEIEVDITGGTHAGQIGVIIAAVDPGSSTARVNVEGEEIQVAVHEVQRRVPEKKDLIKVVSGQQTAQLGETGMLIGIDGEDGIVKMDANSDIKILELENLGKLVRN